MKTTLNLSAALLLGLALSNKRNEAFDLMTNFIKKMQDNRSSILGNMR